MKRPKIRANNCNGKQLLVFDLYDQPGSPEYKKDFDKKGKLGKHFVAATALGYYKGNHIQLDFDSLTKKQVKKFIKRLKKMKNKMK